MRKALFTVILATLILGAALSGASANRISLTNGEHGFQFEWAPLRFTTPGEMIDVRCPVSLEGSFTARTFAKVPGATIGSVTRVPVGTCTFGREIPLTETLPWAIRYEGFTGTLPVIVNINLTLTNQQFRLELSGTTCTTSVEARHPVKDIAVLESAPNGRRLIVDVRADETATIPLTGGALCTLASGAFHNTAEARVLGETATTQLALI